MASGSNLLVNYKSERLDSPDFRNVSPEPQKIERGIRTQFMTATVSGITTDGSYVGVMKWRSYGNTTDLSGGPVKEIAYGNSRLFHRQSTSTTAWSVWRTLVDIPYNTAVGSTVNPIYVAADGKVTASTATIGSASKPVYLNAGTFAVITSYEGNAATATQFASNQSITLTGDTTGTASSTAGWTIATTTTALSKLANADAATLNAWRGGGIAQRNAGALDDFVSVGLAKNDGIVINIPWSASYGQQVYIDDNSWRIAHRYLNGVNADTSVPNWSAWKMIVSSTGNAAQGSATQPVYVDANGQIQTCTAYGNASVNYANSSGNADTVDGKHASAFLTSHQSLANYVTLDGDQTITGTKTFKKRIIAYAYNQSNSLPFITFDKPGSHAAGIGPDGTNNRIHFGPCDLAGTAWTATSSFNSNEWHFQGVITGTSTLNISGGIISNHGHNFMVGGNEVNFIPDGYNNIFWFNYETFNRKGNGNVTQYIFGNGKHGSLATINSDGSYSGNAASATYTSNLLGVNTSNSPYGYTEGNIIRAVWNVHNDNRWYFRAGSFQCRVDYANSASSASSATSSTYLAIDNTANRASCLQFMQRADGVDSPSATWYQILKMNHGTGDSYYKRTLAFEFWGYNIWTNYAAGNGANNTWKHVWVEGNSVTSAVWNDYAECRQSHCEEFGYVVYELGDDTVDKTTERLQHFAGITSDTWGFSQGETEKAKTPIAVAGRVLAYPYRPREEYKPGDCLCAAPGGTVDIMTREEVLLYPDRIIGTVSCVPQYDVWGGGEYDYRDPIRVNGRIWVKVR